MFRLRQLVIFFDAITSFIWGFSFIDILPKIISGNLILTNSDNVIKLLISIIGVVYMAFRVYFYVRKSKQEERLQEQLIIQKERENKHDEELIALLLEEKKRRNFLIGNEFLTEKK